MGIRIHKSIGYGLSDVQASNYDIHDERFNLEDGYFKDRNENDFTIQGLKNYIQEQHDKEKNDAGYSMLTFELLKLEENEWYDIHQFVSHNGEFGLPEVLMFQPPMKDWSRYDDIIDYIEDEKQENKVRLLNRAIYPYEFWINKDTGKSTFEVEGRNYHYLHIRQAINFGFEYDPDKLKEAGFDSMEDADQKIVPGIPDFIICLCKYLKIFKDDKNIFDLKPMVYSFWG